MDAVNTPAHPTSTLIIRHLGLQAYPAVLQAMQTFTKTRTPHTLDELWLLEHPSVYTLGRNAKPEHLLNTGKIPVIPIDRGGQVTYHGEGQLIIYTLLNLKRLGLGVKQLVNLLEQSVIQLLAAHQITAYAKPDAPGVYIKIDHIEKKIAALGLRVSRGCTYHGLSINVQMDLAPFLGINPCGYANLAVTQCHELGIRVTTSQLAEQLIPYLTMLLGFPPSALSHEHQPHPLLPQP
ncbi:MAG TPA: lipoyl(octanoyl) transferase LipB [Thiothrix sp.]|nr:lipoyl(octanoyl) transferase LipB [Thiothrix sp.]